MAFISFIDTPFSNQKFISIDSKIRFTVSLAELLSLSVVPYSKVTAVLRLFALTIPLNVAVVPVTQLRLNSQSLAGKIISKFKIVNEDAVNAITYRAPSPSAPLRTIPPSTSSTIPEYTYFHSFAHFIIP